MKFSIKYIFSKCDQIRRKLPIWSHLLKKTIMENFIFCAVHSSNSYLGPRGKFDTFQEVLYSKIPLIRPRPYINPLRIYGPQICHPINIPPKVYETSSLLKMSLFLKSVHAFC